MSDRFTFSTSSSGKKLPSLTFHVSFFLEKSQMADFDVAEKPIAGLIRKVMQIDTEVWFFFGKRKFLSINYSSGGILRDEN
jgi:hypothetical protein